MSFVQPVGTLSKIEMASTGCKEKHDKTLLRMSDHKQFTLLRDSGVDVLAMYEQAESIDKECQKAYKYETDDDDDDDEKPDPRIQGLQPNGEWKEAQHKLKLASKGS